MTALQDEMAIITGVTLNSAPITYSRNIRHRAVQARAPGGESLCAYHGKTDSVEGKTPVVLAPRDCLEYSGVSTTTTTIASQSDLLQTMLFNPDIPSTESFLFSISGDVANSIRLALASEQSWDDWEAAVEGAWAALRCVVNASCKARTALTDK